MPTGLLLWPLSPVSQILLVVSADEICFQSRGGLIQFGAWTCSVYFAAPQCPPSHFAQTTPGAASHPAVMAASIHHPWWVLLICSCTLCSSVWNNGFLLGHVSGSHFPPEAKWGQTGIPWPLMVACQRIFMSLNSQMHSRLLRVWLYPGVGLFFSSHQGGLPSILDEVCLSPPHIMESCGLSSGWPMPFWCITHHCGRAQRVTFLLCFLCLPGVTKFFFIVGRESVLASIDSTMRSGWGRVQSCISSRNWDLLFF